MVKSIDTLCDDVYQVILKNGGWTEVINDHFKERLGGTISTRLIPSEEERKPSLRMSNIGKPCARQLWYEVNNSGEGEELPPHVHFKFLYGDILEDLLLSLAEAAGHTVEGEQGSVTIEGIKGHRDAIIDGHLVDVKSCSQFAFDKFEANGLRGYTNKYGHYIPAERADGFGYIRQLSSYLYAGQDDPLIKDKTHASFWVVDKVSGRLHLDTYDMSNELKSKQQFFIDRKEMINAPEPPTRQFHPEEDGYYKGRGATREFKPNGNRKLPVSCVYCPFKSTCHPGLRTFQSSRGPVYLTTVKKEPTLREII